MKSFLILGYGYTGQYLEKQLKASIDDVEVFKTNRQEKQNIYFDLSIEESWENLPTVDGTFWTFPAKNIKLVEKFLSQMSERLGRIVVMGSTRSIKIEKEHQEVSESSEVDLEIDRSRGEKTICQQGGILVSSAGIYGPGRNPVDWVRKGWVAPCKKFLNVIHVADLVKILVAAMLDGQDGRTYLASDGQPYTWEDLISRWKRQYDVKTATEPARSMRQSKKVNPRKTLNDLNIELSYPDVYSGVSEIEL